MQKKGGVGRMWGGGGKLSREVTQFSPKGKRKKKKQDELLVARKRKQKKGVMGGNFMR